MDTNQPTAQTNYNPATKAPGIFGGKIPSGVAFALAILLFALPFSEIKCGSNALTNKSGLNFALGKDWTAAGGYGKEFMGKMTSKTTGKKEGNTQIFAIAALGLGVLGLLLCLAGSKAGASGAMVAAVLAAGALIALMFDLKKWFNDLLAKEATEKAKEGADALGLDKIGDSMNPTLAFTPWFYVAIIAFLAAAFFCYKRMSVPK